MTDDLDRRAALLTGWRYYYMPHHPYGYGGELGRDESAVVAVLAPSAPQFNMPWELVPEGMAFRIPNDADHVVIPFRPTSNPVDTRALEMAVVADGELHVAVGVNSQSAQALVIFRRRSGTLASAYTTLEDDGPNYVELAITRACVAALEAARAKETG